MPLPGAWDDRVLERTYEDDRGNPMSGTVTITASVGYVEDTEEDTAWFSRPVTVDLDGAGKASLTVRTSDPDMLQHGYTHKVVEDLVFEAIPGQATPGPIHNEYYILVEPGPDPLLYGKLAPVQPGQGVVITPGLEGPEGPAGPEGPEGPAGDDGADGADAFEVWLAQPGNAGLTFADWQLSLKGDPGDVSGLATVATSGSVADLIDYVAPIPATSSQTQGILAAKVLVACDYNTGTSTWDAAPDSRLRRVFQSTAANDPAALSQERDIWIVEAS